MRVLPRVMSLTCWKGIGSPVVVPSSTLLTAFDGNSHRPHGIVPAFPICVGGKTVNIEVDVSMNSSSKCTKKNHFSYA